MANVLHRWWREPQSKEDIKALLSSTAHPENCDGVKNVLINKPIYKIMKKPDRDRDRPLKHITNVLVRGGQALVQAWDILSHAEI